MTEETKATRNFLDEMEGIVVFENSERELSEDHKKDLMALDELHSRLCEEFEKKEEQLLTANSQIELLVQHNKELKVRISGRELEYETVCEVLFEKEQQLQAKDKEIERLTEIFELWLQGHQKDWEKLVKEGNRAKMSAFLSKNNQNSIDNLLSKLKEFGYKDNVKSIIIKDYEEGLKQISRQKTLEEMKDNPDYMDEDGDFIGDFEFAYDKLVKVARQALENNLEKHKEQ